MFGAKLSSRARAVLSITALLATTATNYSQGKDPAMVYRVPRLKQPLAVDAPWDGEVWGRIKPLELKHFMGTRPEHFPHVQAKLAYGKDALYVIFRVDDRYVRAVAKKHQDSVCRDSCVEFFFTPGEDVSKGYFNLEMNCGGTMLLHYQAVPRKNPLPIAPEDLARIEVTHKMPKIVDPEIKERTLWTVAYSLPLDLLSRYMPTGVVQPAPGVTWRANFYKCADSTSHPHWLTWSPVEFERPDFHRPDQFGTIVFE